MGNFDRYASTQDAAADLAWIWQRALLEHVPEGTVDVRIAYYADQLRATPTLAAAVGQQLGDANAEQLVAWADALGAPPEVAQGHGTAPLRQFVDWLAGRRGLDNALVRFFVNKFLSEVDRYLGDQESATRLEVRRIVEQTLEQHQPDVVIAHSLGSVVAYEALIARPDLHVDLFVTIGSPLALDTIVYDRLLRDGDDTPSRRPNVRSWINVSDVGDVVAVPRSFASRFDVDTEHEESLGLTSMHDAVDYLRTKTIGGIVAAAG
ncbi:hypothetical protein AB0K00_43385 [Dactylosporangium sp. NPDC049525]|uniref:hypothetical protein n=1 Tax=Dactylosporangium sp. NPDC049525 TaxID=3154730 RepID=UPI003448F15F